MSQNQQLVSILNDIQTKLTMIGESIKANAYGKAAVAISKHDKDINKPEDLMGIRSVGDSIRSKLTEFMQTGKIQYLEQLNNAPEFTFLKVYGIGPKVARKLVSDGYKSIDDLKQNMDILKRWSAIIIWLERMD